MPLTTVPRSVALRGRARHDGAIAEHRDVVAHLENLGEVVRHEHDPDTLVGKRSDQAHDEPHRDIGQRGGRLVHQQDARLAAHGLDDLHHLFQVVGQRRDERFGPRVDLVEAQQRRHFLVEFTAAQQPGTAPGGLVVQHDVFGHRHAADEIDVLVDGDDPVPERVIRARQRDRVAVEPHDTGIGPVDAGHDLEQRALAGPVFADEAVHAAGLDREVDTLERPHAGEALDDGFALEDGGRQALDDLATRARTGRPPPPRAGERAAVVDAAYLPVTCGSLANSAALSLVSTRVGRSMRAGGLPPVSLVAMAFMPS